LRGNHEDMLIQAYSSPSKRIQDWYAGNGGDTTLESFGVSHANDIPKKYITFLQKLPIVKVYKNFLIGHAGVNLNQTEAPLRKTDSNYNYILWNREVQPDTLGRRRLVVGHTPMNITQIKKSATTAKVMIDGGCAYGGNLVAFCLDTNNVVHIKGLHA
jgi:serine/threonine protein phosphatase 1